MLGLGGFLVCRRLERRLRQRLRGIVCRLQWFTRRVGLGIGPIPVIAIAPSATAAATTTTLCRFARFDGFLRAGDEPFVVLDRGAFLHACRARWRGAAPGRRARRRCDGSARGSADKFAVLHRAFGAQGTARWAILTWSAGFAGFAGRATLRVGS